MRNLTAIDAVVRWMTLTIACVVALLVLPPAIVGQSRIGVALLLAAALAVAVAAKARFTHRAEGTSPGPTVSPATPGHKTAATA